MEMVMIAADQVMFGVPNLYWKIRIDDMNVY